MYPDDRNVYGHSLPISLVFFSSFLVTFGRVLTGLKMLGKERHGVEWIIQIGPQVNSYLDHTVPIVPSIVYQSIWCLTSSNNNLSKLCLRRRSSWVQKG
ncbi:hypothetical protein P280DRAFT_290489 [Massarina eburnea CBS 473.64]|uniref:Uncharacterized protein n=1 Tax=Massarina eburnea CBS 473.64 TaxID=1395130 RepID=A0A6A6S5J1_9PLEO|nr:hypothetical protein P280DRAFT_290489 [Massarina eburnea CBS 473.64]